MIANSLNYGAAGRRRTAATARRRPTPRNMQIYELARVQGVRQEDVAQRFGINQQRVSQICRQVEAWSRWMRGSPDKDTRAADERLRTLLLIRQREEQVLLLALRHVMAGSETCLTEKRVTTKHGTQVETHEKVLPVHPGWLNAATRAMKSVARISERLGVDMEATCAAKEIDALLAQIAGQQVAGGDTAQPEPNEGANSSTPSR